MRKAQRQMKTRIPDLNRVVSYMLEYRNKGDKALLAENPGETYYKLFILPFWLWYWSRPFFRNTQAGQAPHPSPGIPL